MAGDRLVHGVVEDLGREVVKRGLVGAADIHARPAPDRLQPFQNLDILRRVAAIRLGSGQGLVHDVFPHETPNLSARGTLGKVPT